VIVSSHDGVMTSWGEFAAAEPEFAERVLQRFTSRKHSTLATLRRDGSPRISGTEVVFESGELSMGMMPGSRKARDLQRDARLALHSPTSDAPEDDPSSWAGEAKISGRAIEVLQPEGQDDHRFTVDVIEVVLTCVGEPADHLLIESWHPGRGREQRRRS
jgi:hypothetical protein